jgi:hypothetical protein
LPDWEILNFTPQERVDGGKSGYATVQTLSIHLIRKLRR